MSADPAPVKWKKRRRHGAPGVGGDNSRPAELSAALARCALRGALAHGCAYVRAEPYVARLLDRLCIGRVLRGAAAAGLPETDPLPPPAAAPWAPGQPRQPQPPPLLRLSMLEAVFLAHGLECLTLYDVQVRPSHGRLRPGPALTPATRAGAAGGGRCHHARPHRHVA